MTRVDRAVATLRGIAARDPAMATAHLAPGFLDHDPVSGSGGADGLRALVAALPARPSRLEVARVVEDGPLVVVHGRGRTGDEVFFDAFRFEDELVAEHWTFQAPAASPNASGHSQTDGPAAPDPRADTEASKAMVRNYYQTVHIGGDHGAVRRFMAGEVQIRHEPGVRDGVAAFEADLAVLTRDRTIDTVVLLAGQGDLVFIAARGTHEGRPCAYLDLYRVERGKLVEHWGFPQELSPND